MVYFAVKMTDRYSRQILFSGIGRAGQEALGRAHVVLVGCGALGCAIAEMLSRAGIGKMTLIDRDFVDFSNLQRQQLFTTADAEARLPKAEAAKKRLQAFNPEVEVEAHVAEADATLLQSILQRGQTQLLLDGTDNLDTRLLINDCAMKFAVPWVYGACVGSSGAMMFIEKGKTPCLRCIYGEVSGDLLTCDTAGIISPAVQQTAALQVSAALKYLVGQRGALANALVTFDLWHESYLSLKMEAARLEDCPSCGPEANYPALQSQGVTSFLRLCGRDAVQVRPRTQLLSLDALAARLAPQVTFTHHNAHLLSFSFQARQVTVFKDGRTVIHGVSSVEEGKKLYYQLFA